MSRRGLPSTTRMRHDRHFVEQLAARTVETVGSVLPLDDLRPNPDQPRQRFADLDELAASIRRVGVLEPLLVREAPDGYLIVSGERRFRAAREAGLTEVPCIVLDLDEAEVLEVALIENLQRQDLSPFEEAEGLQALIDRFGYTHEEVSERIGKSRPTVTESLSLNEIPADLREALEEAGVRAKSALLEVARIEDPGEQRALVEMIVSEGLTRDEIRALRRGGGRAPGSDAGSGEEAGETSADVGGSKSSAAGGSAGRGGRHLTYRSSTGITVTLYLSKPEITLQEIRTTLQEAIAELEDPPG